MKAVVVNQAAPIEDVALHTTDVEVPQAGPGDVLIRVKACGLCRTDLHVIEGDLPQRKLPLIPGHQAIGVVEQAGQGASGVKPGDRVGVAWLHWTCGACSFCKSGRENLCIRARFTGYDVDGGYAEYISAPADFVYRIPESFSDEHAAPLLCGGVIGYRALKLSGVGTRTAAGLVRVRLLSAHSASAGAISEMPRVCLHQKRGAPGDGAGNGSGMGGHGG